MRLSCENNLMEPSSLIVHCTRMDGLHYTLIQEIEAQVESRVCFWQPKSKNLFSKSLLTLKDLDAPKLKNL